MNYTAARLNCQRNGMQLYDTNDSFESTPLTELMSFASETWPTSGNVLYIKGRRDTSCANINNTQKGFQSGFGSCDQLLPSICQFIDASSKNSLFLVSQEPNH
jgi:hypothetical protein